MLESASILFVFMILVNILVLSVNLGFLWTMKSDDRIETDCITSCIPCDDTETSYCCDCSEGALSSYLTKRFEKTSMKKTRYPLKHEKKSQRPLQFKNRIPRFLKPVACLAGAKSNNQPKPAERGGLTSLLSWSKRNYYYISNGIKLRNGRLVVPVSGQYYIYGMVNIIDDVPCNKSETQDSETKIVMTKFNILSGEEDLFVTEVPRTLLRNRMTNNKDVYLGSTIPLKAEDEIYIRVSNIDRVKNPYQNLIGLYML